MIKKHFCNNLVYGEAFENEPFVVVEIGTAINGRLKGVLSDCSGKVQCEISETLAEDISLSTHVGDVFFVSASIMTDKREPLLKIKSMTLCTRNDYVTKQLFTGISEEKINEYISLIREICKKITHPGYLALVNACLTDENLKKLGELPATHSFYGTYLGGALAATCSVTYMTKSVMAAYINKGNGITTMPPAWNVLLTAALLHSFGSIEYCDSNNPFTKTKHGLSMNYLTTLQHNIEHVIFKNNIELTKQEFANLMNVLNVGVSKKTDSKAVSKDGTILRYIINLYGECDAIDFQIANHSAKEEEDFFYVKNLSRYLLKEVEG